MISWTEWRSARAEHAPRRRRTDRGKAWYIVGIVCLLVSVGAALASSRSSSHAAGSAAASSKAAAASAHASRVTSDKVDALVSTIQAERVRNTMVACIAQNRRNASTEKALAERTPDPEVRAFAGALIDALAPVQDCVALVKKRVPSAKTGG